MGESAGAQERGRERRLAVDGALLAVVVGGAVLRFWGLGAQSLWYDEWLTVEATSGGLLDLLRHVANREGIPPPYFLLMWGWVRIFGDGEVALRLVSALAGVATIPVVHAAVRGLGLARRVGLVAALLVAVNPMLVWYSQEARPYSLLALLGATSLLAFARVWRHGHRRDWVMWSVTGAGVVAVHYFAAFLVAAQALALLVGLHQHAAARNGRVAAGRADERASAATGTGHGSGDRVSEPVPPAAGPQAVPGAPSRRRAWRQVGLAVLPCGIVLGALAPIALRQHSHEANRRWISAFPLPERMSDAGRSALVGPSPPVDRLWMVAAAAVGLATLLLALRADRERRAAALAMAGIGFGAVVLPLAATAVGVDVVLGRYLIAALIPLVVAVAAGLLVAPRPRRDLGQERVQRREPVAPGAGLAGLAGVGLLCGVSLVAVVAVARDPDLQRAEWRDVAEATEQGDGRRVLVINVHGGQASPLHHYLKGSRPLDDGEAVRVEGVDVLVTTPTDRPCSFLVGRGCGMIFLGAPLPDPLAGRFRLVQEVELDQFRIDRYRAEAPVTVTGEDLVRPLDRPGALVLVVPGTGDAAEDV